jgi:hypothetical protein
MPSSSLGCGAPTRCCTAGCNGRRERSWRSSHDHDPSFINHDDGNPGEWVCTCGNTECGSGFTPCDATGKDIEPLNGWPDLYRCGTCNSIIKHPTREIIRRGTARFRIQFTETTVFETWVTAPTAIEAANRAHRQFDDEGPENLTFVSNSTCDWLAFNENGDVTDINDDDLEVDESQEELPM